MCARGSSRFSEVMDEEVTKPTIETVLERMGAIEARTHQRMDGMEQRINQRIGVMEERVNQRMDGIEGRVNQRMDGMGERIHQRIYGLEQRLDRIESVANITRSELLNLRARFS